MPFIELNVLNNATQPIIGIDLGTTNSLAAIWRDGRPQILRPARHNGRVPSAIWFPEDKDAPPIVGEAARERALADPRGALFSVKRFMGRGLSDVQQDLETIAFPASETEHGLIRFDIRGRKVTPQELSAMILMRVHDVACQAMGTDIPSRVVITVPAYFDDAQRQATRDAARLAGLEVVRIVNEPTAASLAYGLDQKKEGTVAVYDLGGGTFDVSVLTIEEGVFRVLSTAGDTHLGGDDIDRALAGLALAELSSKVDAATASDPGFLLGVRLAAEKCKIKLSSDSQAELHVIDPEKGFNWRRTVTRDELDALIEPLVDRSLDACRQALSDAGLELSAIDEVVLVGGSTRIPYVRAEVERFFGKKPHVELDPDEVVALGAAVQGHVLAGGTRDILLLDVTPLSLGVETMGGAVDKIVQRNTGVPCTYMATFTTYADNQTGMDFHIVQGERELARDCRSLGRFKLKDLPPRPAGMVKVNVRYQIDANGLLQVTAREDSTGASAGVEVQPMHGMTDDQVETMLKASYDHAREDFDNRHLADLKVELGIMLRATESRLPDVTDELDRESQRDIRDAIASAKAAIANEDLAAARTARDELERATMPLAALLMDRVARTALSGKSLDEV